MKKIAKLWIFGLTFLLFFVCSSIKLGSMGQLQLQLRPSNLEILDVAGEIEQDDFMFTQAPKVNIIVYSAMLGYVDKDGTEHFPVPKISLKKTSKMKFYVDFKATKNVYISAVLSILGPETSSWVSPKHVKKNVYYRSVIEFDFERLDEPPVPGLYEVIVQIKPGYGENLVFNSGGMTHVSFRYQVTK